MTPKQELFYETMANALASATQIPAEVRAVHCRSAAVTFRADKFSKANVIAFALGTAKKLVSAHARQIGEFSPESIAARARNTPTVA